ncbi:MAG: hypothetical protein NZ455_16860 [Bacteroidia bacterium]|nr:hypothetical protein [Bacteroidia bacterium]
MRNAVKHRSGSAVLYSPTRSEARDTPGKNIKIFFAFFLVYYLSIWLTF